MATKAHLAANKRYQDKLDKIVIYTPKGQKDKIKAHAKSLNISVNAYILSLIEKDIPHVSE